MKLNARLVPVDELCRDDQSRMLALMQRHYANVSRRVFEADLAEKQWVIQVRDVTGRLCGFSTQMLLDVAVDDRHIKVLFSGDTIIDREHWGDQALVHVWGRLALAIIDDWPSRELYWFLISQGYKTYRFLPVFFHEFYPRYDLPTPAWAGQVLDRLGRTKFPADYDPAAGVVRAHAGQYRLREGIAELTPQRCRDPHVRFFAERNPGHAAGDELCCIAPLTRDNFTSAAYRVIGPESATLRVS